VPVDLSHHASRQLGYRIQSDRIEEWCHHHICPGCSRGFDRSIHVRHQVARALRAEGTGMGVLNPNKETVPTGIYSSCEVVLLEVGVRRAPLSRYRRIASTFRLTVQKTSFTAFLRRRAAE
jgi:hypothetical protein